MIKNREFQAKVDFVKENTSHVQTLYAQFRHDLDKQLERGEITSVNLKESKHREEFEFPTGWFSRMYQRSNGFDVMGIRCLKGCDFPDHSYPKQCIQLFVLSGSIHISMKNLGEVALGAGENIRIEPKQSHAIRPLEDSHILLISRPNIQ